VVIIYTPKHLKIDSCGFCSLQITVVNITMDKPKQTGQNLGGASFKLKVWACLCREFLLQGRLCTVDLLVKPACFVKNKNSILSVQNTWSELVSYDKVVNRTDPSSSVRIPWLVYAIKLNSQQKQLNLKLKTWPEQPFSNMLAFTVDTSWVCLFYKGFICKMDVVVIVTYLIIVVNYNRVELNHRVYAIKQ